MTALPSIETHLADLVPSALEAGAVPKALKAFRLEVRSHLEGLHREERSGRRVNEANSDLTDRMIRRLVQLAEDELVSEGGELHDGLCVVAVGGYARREMSIFSDVDLLVLYRKEVTPYVERIAERLQYWLWDAGLSVGCATRTIADTVQLGREDSTVRTAVLMARFLCGDGEFFHLFADAIRRELLPDPLGFIDDQIALLRERHERMGESLFLLQPNVKEGAGALRDYHAAYWVLRGIQPSARDADDLLHFGLLNENEMSEFRAAIEFFWLIRNELHLTVKRSSDQMSFELQEMIAEGLDYGGPQPQSEEDAEHPVELPVERFMRDYYRHARVLQAHSEMAIDLCRKRVVGSAGKRSAEAEEDAFQLVGDALEIKHSSLLREDPRRLLSAFRVAQQWEVPLARSALRMIREHLYLVDDEMRTDPDAVDLFCGVLNAENRVMRSLMAMNDVGLLGRFLPEWEHIVCRWQHVIYHTYTVDVHSIFLVEELRRLYRGKYEDFAPDLTEMIHQVEDRTVLFLGCLLHDIGKGFGGDHSRRGAVRARTCLTRMGFDPDRMDRILFVVEHHLLMSHLAQRRDLSDPKLLLEFAQLCGDRENLHNLYLATFADIRASSRDAWTEWKGQLLKELFERTAEILETGADSDKAVALIEERVETRRRGAGKELAEAGIPPEQIQQYFDGMPRRYFVSHTPRQIARHARAAFEIGGDPPLATAFRVMRGGFTEFIVWTRDQHALYSNISGSITGCGINILGSHVYTARSGLALEVYRIATPDGGEPERDLAFSELRSTLASVLRGDLDVPTLLDRRAPRRTTKVPNPEPSRVSVSNEISDFYTVIDVSTDDRIGLLYELTRTIGEHDLEIFVSKAGTIRDQVADTFYVRRADGKRQLDVEACKQLESALLEVLTVEGAGDGARHG